MARPHLAVMGFLSTGTGEVALFSAGRLVAQQLTQRRRSGLVHSRPHGHFDSFHIQMTAFASILKNNVEQRAYFAFDFLADCLRRFFSCGVSVSSSGLARQILSLVSIKVRLSS